VTLFDLPFAQRDAAPLREARGLLSLMSIPGVGPGKALTLARRYASWDEMRAAGVDQLGAMIGNAADMVLHSPREFPVEIPSGVSLVGYFDASFPGQLREIPSPPAVLWVRGDLARLERAVAIVGTRGPTGRGLATTRALSTHVSEIGGSVVSGLALGVDAAAHEACLDAGGRTIAVLGSGVDVPSPAQHGGLAARILDCGGALVSELPLGTVPSPRTLVARNRLQSGLSRCVIVAQCGVPSGTLHTAGFALQQGRMLAARSPDPVDDPVDWGGNAALLDPRGISAWRGADLPTNLLRHAPRSRPAATALTTLEDLDALL
jgi:DNA processing protein